MPEPKQPARVKVAFHYSASGARGSLTVENLRAPLLALADKVHANRAAFDNKPKRTKCPVLPSSRSSAPHVAARALWESGQHADALQLAGNVGAVFIGRPVQGSVTGMPYMGAESVDAGKHNFTIARCIPSGRFRVLHTRSALAVDRAASSVSEKDGFSTYSAAFDWLETSAACDAWCTKVTVAATKCADFEQAAALAHYMADPADETAPAATIDAAPVPTPTEPAPGVPAPAPADPDLIRSGWNDAPTIPAAAAILTDAEIIQSLTDAANCSANVIYVSEEEFNRNVAALDARAASEAAARAALRAPGTLAEKLASAAAVRAEHATPTRTFSTEKPATPPALSEPMPAPSFAYPVRKKPGRVPSRWALFDRHGAMVTWTTGTRGKNCLTQSIYDYSNHPDAPHTVSKVTHDTCDAWSAAQYAADRAATHTPPATPTRALSTEIVSTPPAYSQQETGPEWFARVQREVAGKLTRAESLATTADGFVKFTHADGVRFGLAGEDMSEPGRFRFTYFDDHGPIGHSTRDTLAAAVWEGMDLSYVPIEPGTPTRVIGHVAPPPTHSKAIAAQA